jgi:hypothetical protein
MAAAALTSKITTATSPLGQELGFFSLLNFQKSPERGTFYS